MFSNIWNKIKNFSTPHTVDTATPQTYWEHGMFAAKNSFLVAVGGLAGLIHAVIPGVFKFTTSTIVIKSFKKLVDSRRHHDELNEFLPGYLKDEHYKK